MTWQLDKLGVVIALILAAGAVLLPFATFRANRIVPGTTQSIFAALPLWAAGFLFAVVLAVVVIAALKSPGILRLGGSLLGLAAIAVLIGVAAGHLAPAANPYARVSPASGFWLLTFGFALLATDAFTKLRPTPFVRIAVLVGVGLAAWALLGSGQWNGLSIMKEYASRADSFWTELGRHITLALGSLAAAVIVGLPLGILCHRVRKLRAGVLNVLNMVQTIPSIALFGLLIAPLAWIAANVPGASSIGIRGIGGAPAFVALFLYSLLPVVANTVVGLASVSPVANDAARGVGMTERQRLFGVELPLALPLILTGIRIVLVQNIGMATIAALIGGGGLGVFVFQGIGQTALDLVLLGALPTVAMAFAAAVVLDAGIELSRPQGTRA